MSSENSSLKPPSFSTLLCVHRFLTHVLLIAVMVGLAGCSGPLQFLGLTGNEEGTVAIFPTDGESLRQLSADKFQPEEGGDELVGFRSFSSDFGGVTGVALSPDGDTYYVGGEDGSVRRYRLASARKIEESTLFKSERPVLALAVSPDGQKIAIAQTSQVVVFDLTERKRLHVLTLVKGRITALEWDPRGELIAIGAASGDISIWSLREGFFEGRGRNSYEALEVYKGGRSPIVEIRFHPSGGTFFSAEYEGVVSLWRLLRTERELGLRDDFAVSDQHRETSRRQVLGSVSGKLSDLWLDGDGRTLYAAGGDGGIYSWKIRGLRLLNKVEVSQDEQFTLSGYTRSRGDHLIDLIFSAGRDQRVSLVCHRRSAQVQDAGEDAAETLPRLVSRSGLLRTPIGKLRLGLSGMLWGAEKSDRLWVFDAAAFFTSPAGEKILSRCTAG